MNLIKRLFKTGGNAIITLFPFKYKSVWMFNDKTTNLKNEAFVLGIDSMLDILTKDIPKAENGFRLTISDSPFPNHTVTLQRRSREGGGRWYWSPDYKIEGWLCPALFKYYLIAPKRLYARADAIQQKG